MTDAAIARLPTPPPNRPNNTQLDTMSDDDLANVIDPDCCPDCGAAVCDFHWGAKAGFEAALRETACLEALRVEAEERQEGRQWVRRLFVGRTFDRLREQH